MGSRRIEVEIIGDARGFGRAVAEAESKTGRLKSALKGIAAAGVFTGVAALGAAFKVGFDELSEAQVVAKDTAAVLKSTGGVANVTAANVEKLAGAISNYSGMDDEAIAKSQNLLLTFTKVRNEVGKGNDVFNQATIAAADMSARLGIDLNSAVMGIGKALNDPIKGVAALTKRGVQFTDQQKDQIKALQESGDMLGAQKVILGELETQFGGAAKAAGDTLPGKLNRAKNAFAEMSAQLLTLALPLLERLAVGVQVASQWLGQNLPAAWQRVQAVTSAVVNWYRANVAATFQAVALRVRQVWGAVGGYVMAFTRVFLTTVVGVARGLLNVVVGVFKVVGALIRGDWSAMWNAVKQVASGALRAVVSLIRGAVGMTLAAAKAVGQAIWKGVKEGAKKLVELAGELIRMIGDAIKDAAEKALTLAKEIGKAIGRGVVDGVKSMAGAIGDAVTGIVTGPLGKVKGFLGINSPSKWVAENIGAPIGQGVTMGIDGERRNVGASFSRLAGSVMGVAAPAVGAGGVPRGVGSGGGGVTMHIHEAQRMDPQELARYTSWQYRRVMAGGVA